MASAELVQDPSPALFPRSRPEGDAAAAFSVGRVAAVPVMVGAAVAILAAVAFWSPVLNGDSVWALGWGEQLARGELETFKPGPTPHPLTVALAALTSPLGLQGAYVFTYLLFGPLALGWLAAAVFELARRTSSSTWCALVAVALLLTSSSVIWWAASARYDVAFGALVLTATAWRLSRPRSSLVPLGLLAVAGLIRPEAWVLAGVLYLWQLRDLSPSRRVAGMALAGAAPLLWASMDLAVMGDPLYSLHVTDDASQKLYGQYTPAENLAQGARSLVGAVGPIAFLLAPAGMVVGLRRQRRETLIIIAVLGIVIAIFLGLIAKGLASSERYLLLPTCVLLILAPAATVPRGRRRALAVVAGALLLVQALGGLDALTGVRTVFRPATERVRDVHVLTARSDVRHMLRDCRTVAVPTTRMLSELLRYSGRPVSLWTVDSKGTSDPEVFVAPASMSAATSVLTRPRFDSDPTLNVPAGMVPGPTVRHWRVYTAPGAACTR